MTSQWRLYPFDFYEIYTKINQGYLSDISNFVWIEQKRIEIQSREVNIELWRKKWVLSHCNLDLWPKVTNFNRARASAVSNHLAKIASKSVHLFGWNFVHKQSQTHTHIHTQINCSENINPPWFFGGVITQNLKWGQSKVKFRESKKF